MDNQDEPFASLPNASPEDREELVTMLKEGNQRFFSTGDPTEVLGLKGLGADQEAIKAAIAIGAQLVQQGLLDKAFDYFCGLQQLEQLNYEVYRWIGYIMQLKKIHLAAYQAYCAAANLNGTDPVTRILLGECMLMIDKSPVNGMFQIQEGIRLAGKDPKYSAHVKRGEQLLIAAKERIDAEKAAQAAPKK